MCCADVERAERYRTLTDEQSAPVTHPQGPSNPLRAGVALWRECSQLEKCR